MNEDSAKQRRQLETQVERWTSEAKKLLESGKEAAALDLYRRAADELAGAPWLQHRTAELARKLKKSEVAITYFRRAATAFQIANFSKRAVAPLRTAWSLAIEGLPSTSKLLVESAVELMQLHRSLGFAADASVTFERTNAALRVRGFSEIAAQVLDSMQREPAPAWAPAPARSAPPTASPLHLRPAPSSHSSAPPVSESVPRGGGAAPAASLAGARHRALARQFGRR